MNRYFNDREYRKQIREQKSRKGGLRGFFSRKHVQYATAAFVVLLLALTGYIFYLFQALPSIEELENPETAIASEVRSRDGAILDRFYVENRTYVTIDNISPNAINALIATEDHRFFDHWGVDWRSVWRLPYFWR